MSHKSNDIWNEYMHDERGRYVGSVTDQSWTRAVLRLDAKSRLPYLNKMLHSRTSDEDFDYIFLLNRCPRIYLDEYNKGE